MTPSPLIEVIRLHAARDHFPQDYVVPAQPVQQQGPFSIMFGVLFAFSLVGFAAFEAFRFLLD